MEKFKINHTVTINYSPDVCFPDHILAYLYQVIKRLDILLEGKFKINILLKIYGFPGVEYELERVICDEILVDFCNYGMPLQFNSKFDVEIEFYNSIPWDSKKVDCLGDPLPTT